MGHEREESDPESKIAHYCEGMKYGIMLLAEMLCRSHPEIAADIVTRSRIIIQRVNDHEREGDYL